MVEPAGVLAALVPLVVLATPDGPAVGVDEVDRAEVPVVADETPEQHVDHVGAVLRLEARDHGQAPVEGEIEFFSVDPECEELQPHRFSLGILQEWSADSPRPCSSAW